MKHLSKTFVWILMGLLFVGLAGFGAINVSGTTRTLATVGETDVSVDDYARALQQEQRAIQAQSGQSVPLSQLISMGVDRGVLSGLVASAALDNEMQTLGISVGDETLLKEITQIQAFQGSDGAFSRDNYRFALENAGLSEPEFEEDMRAETARTLLQGAIVGGTRMPAALGETLTDYIGARRSFAYVRLSAEDAVLTAVEPTEDELRAYYEANIDAFTLPETKVITYVALRPDALVDEVEVDETALRALYEERDAEFNVPERRLVERLVFADQDAADTAKAQLDVGGTTFETLVQDRGLSLSDIDMGDVAQDDLGAAGEAVFAVEMGDVAGPLPSDLGPALYRVNGLLEASFTSFEDALPALREELALDRARRVIESRAEGIDDLLASGATLEELAAEEHGLAVGRIDWTADTTDGIAAYDTFRTAAEAVSVEDFPTVDYLDDGSVFALRLDEVLDPRPEPFDSARPAVTEAFKADRVAKALKAEADELKAVVEANDGQFPEDRDVTEQTGLTRTAYLDQTPVDLMNEVFEMEVGEVRVVSDAEGTVVVRLDDTLPPDDSDDMQFLTQALSEQLDQSLSNEIFQIYMQAVQTRARPQVNQQAVNAVHATFQ
ncbi:SurA N-terminal domain-containing protein [Tritonibacter scottomollicae]|uniref:SurA N-terminal domain-containing protein n=1 Tax=Tritonibacter scottomollicae TaxID=483013 RepID=A0ABZ0HJF6_TRISK|nr:peptidyl-prolyl cis-trans isomerase [Tritonibacter scottomollicae]WOI34305.1 SurA N-terminal domain-containing protein [Tritonibacter scottomollicae]